MAVKGKVIHVCGRSGMNFVLWMKKRLDEQNITAFIVDCSKSGELYAGFKRIRSKNPFVFTGEDWEVRFKKTGVTIMYHEEIDRYTDFYDGIYLIFTTGHRVEYAGELVKKLSGGRICLFEYTLFPQLSGGNYVYLCILKGGKALDERFVPSCILDKIPGPYETELLDILTKHILMFIRY